MFSNCNTLTDLNKRRLELIQSMKYDLKDINSEYMRAKASINTSKKDFKQVTCRRPVIENITPFVGIPCCGYSEKDLTIVMTPKGFMI